MEGSAALTVVQPVVDDVQYTSPTSNGIDIQLGPLISITPAATGTNPAACTPTPAVTDMPRPIRPILPLPRRIQPSRSTKNIGKDVEKEKSHSEKAIEKDVEKEQRAKGKGKNKAVDGADGDGDGQVEAEEECDKDRVGEEQNVNPVTGRRVRPSRSQKDLGKGAGVHQDTKPGKDAKQNMTVGNTKQNTKPQADKNIKPRAAYKNKNKNKRRKTVGATETVGDLEVHLHAGPGPMAIPGVGAPMTLHGVRGSMTTTIRDVLAENISTVSTMHGGEALGGGGGGLGGVVGVEALGGADVGLSGTGGVERRGSAGGINDVTNLGNGGSRVLASASTFTGGRGANNPVYAVVVPMSSAQQDEVAPTPPLTAPAGPLPTLPVVEAEALASGDGGAAQNSHSGFVSAWSSLGGNIQPKVRRKMKMKMVL